jgi:hypothetical protein
VQCNRKAGAIEEKGERQQQRKGGEEVVAQGYGQREELGRKRVGDLKAGLTNAYSGAR